MRVRFAVGTIWGYQFDAVGNVTARKSYTFKRESGADSPGPLTRMNHGGLWLPITNGIFAGFDVELTGAVTEPRPALEVDVPPEPEPEPPPSSGEQPPLIPIAYTTTPDTNLPAKLAPITDPVYGTRITRIGDAGQRHAYAQIQPWSTGEKYLYLYYPDDGSGNRLLDGRTYAPIKQISPPGRATWVSDTEMVGEGGGVLQKYNVETGARTTLPGSPSGSLGEGQGAPSDDFRYWAVQFGALIRVYDATLQTVVGTITLGATPNNCTMSRKGNFVIVQFGTKGTGLTNGTWLYRRDGTRMRQIWIGHPHMDPGLEADGTTEVLVGILGSDTNPAALWSYNLATGTQRSLVKLPNVWAWVGHVSCRMPGWALASPDSWHSPGNIGNDQLASFDMSKTDATSARVWAHEHCWSGSTYKQQPQGIQSPSGSRVLFASRWTSTGTTVYPFVAEAQ